MTLGQGYGIPLGHRQSLCEIRIRNVSTEKI